MSKRIIAVVGGTGAQGGGLVEALLERGQFAVRVLTRSADGERAKALQARGVEVVAADLADEQSLRQAFSGAYGAFVVTNFWDPTTGNQEADRANKAIQAAKDAGVEHFVWSTLPNVEQLSGGKLNALHFTGKAVVDDRVAEAGFTHHTFVEPPMYFQNFAGVFGPQPLPDGRKGWAVPMDPNARVLHAGDVDDVGRVVARVFEQPEAAGDGQHLAVAPGVMSWTDIVSTLNAQGHDVAVVQVPAEAYDGFFPGAEEMRVMYQWFEGYTYFGPDADKKLAATRTIYPEALTTFAEWAKTNLPARA